MAYEKFFDIVGSMPDVQRVRLLDGTELKDAVIVPNFIDAATANAAWEAVCNCKDRPTSEPLALDFYKPRWVAGEHEALNYRGWPLKRDKMWFQKDTTQLRRYGYTGWQWAVSAGTYALNSIPELEKLVDDVDAKADFTHRHNHWIVTRYKTGQDNIGQHSDKVKDWQPGSAFVVVKLGAPRPFLFTQKVDGVDVELMRPVLQPGTAVIVGYHANQLVKHGVPVVKGECGLSGSIVGRCIATTKEWEEVAKVVEKKRKRARVEEVETESE
jgi:hypothetical protein